MLSIYSISLRGALPALPTLISALLAPLPLAGAFLALPILSGALSAPLLPLTRALFALLSF